MKTTRAIRFGLALVAVPACSKDPPPRQDATTREEAGVHAWVARGPTTTDGLSAERTRRYIEAGVRATLDGPDGTNSAVNARCQSDLGDVSIHCSELGLERIGSFVDRVQDGIAAWREETTQHPELLSGSSLIIDIRSNGMADSVQVNTSAPWARARNARAIRTYRGYVSKFSGTNIHAPDVSEFDLNRVFACIRAYEALELVQGILVKTPDLPQSRVTVSLSCTVSARPGPQYRGATVELSSRLAVPEALTEETMRRFRAKGYSSQ